MLDNGGPVGAVFEFEGQQYHVKPTVICGEAFERYKAAIQTARYTHLRALLLTETHPQLRMDLMEKLSSPVQGLTELLRIFQDPSFLHLAILYAVDDMTEALAKRIVAHYPDFTELSTLVQNASGLEKLKNLFAQSQNEKQDAEANSQNK